ncbi:PREDICTED: aspartic [Prunus dulcis]|uniref:PREDICTED: aspartic n=1 Tax=Prunus dulcis TaxID=3755 RepID=A0A5E4G4E7_PRUDU|nr:PREDICTED: aspartic [Prunus dulcis]
MEAISVGNNRVPFPLSIRLEGNVIIDLGTTQTILPEEYTQLESRNTFLRHNEEILCFAFALDGYYGTYGNLAQMNFLVGYDFQKHTVSFKPTDYTKLHRSLV